MIIKVQAEIYLEVSTTEDKAVKNLKTVSGFGIKHIEPITWDMVSSDELESVTDSCPQ